MVAFIGTYLSTRLLTDSLEERFTRQLIDAGSAVADGLAQREQLHLATLRTIAFTEGIDEVILVGDQVQLQNLLFPIMANNNIDRVDVVNADGYHLLTIYRPPGAEAVEDYLTTSADLTDWSIVEKVLSGDIDAQGDKYVALNTIDGNDLFFTAGPVKQEGKIVGGVLVSSYVQNLIYSLKQTTFADVSLYDLGGNLVGTTIPGGENAEDIQIMSAKEMRPLLALEGDISPRRSITFGGHEYDLLYDIFWARGEPLGIYAVAIPTTYIVSHETNIRNYMFVIFGLALGLVLGIGYLMARRITGRLRHLMESAMAVAEGDFSRRIHISSNDEIGSLARSLDHMTKNLADYTEALQDRIEELITLYNSSSAVTIRSGLNLEHVLQAVANSVRGVIRGTDQVTIYLLDRDSQVLVPRVTAPKEAYALPPLAFEQGSNIHNLLRTTRPQIVSVAELRTYTQGYFSTNGATDVLVASLIAGQEIIGMLTLIPTVSHPRELLTEDSERLLGTLANQAAISIKNAQLFEATQQAYEELQQLDDLKSQFVNIAAHELRTPLGAMMGYVSFMQKRIPPNLQKTMDFLMVSTLRMRTMVDAMLTIQRLDAGKAFLRISSVDIGHILQKTVADFKPMAELEGHVVILDLPDNLPPIQVDAEKIDLVFTNLLSNAIKFTPEHGRIEIAVRDQDGSILLSFRDNGVGIRPEDQPRIFERFYQVPVDHLAGHGGMGIGLTTVKHLVELHGGTVWLKSELGQGSEFFVSLPKTISASPETMTSVPEPDVQLFEPEGSLVNV
ncbi:MAG: HAMP domain-containing protein [Anaerolineae bacterium]|nr:HAMP domain-containing protein [Anaerolineae bacterium]